MRPDRCGAIDAAPAVAVSAQTGEGLDALRGAIARALTASDPIA